MSELKPQAESLESLLSTAIGLLMGYEDRDGKGGTSNPYKSGSVVAKFVAECVERLKDWPMTTSTQQPQAEAVSDDLRDRLVAISAAIADQDDRAAQEMIREILAAPQQADSLPERDTSKPAEQQGLFRKFVVRRTDGSDAPGGKHDGCDYFVLDVTHDAHAKAALAAYAAAVEETHPQLAVDMRARYELAAPQQADAVHTKCAHDWSPEYDHKTYPGAVRVLSSYCLKCGTPQKGGGQ